MSNTVTPATNNFSFRGFLTKGLALAALSRAGNAAPQDVTTFCGLTIGESQPSEWSLCTAKTDGGQTKFTAWSTEAANNCRFSLNKLQDSSFTSLYCVLLQVILQI